jgi:hypothetical protein
MNKPVWGIQNREKHAENLNGWIRVKAGQWLEGVKECRAGTLQDEKYEK